MISLDVSIDVSDLAKALEEFGSAAAKTFKLNLDEINKSVTEINNMSVIRTRHTVLAKVASHGSGGKAKVVCGAEACTEGFSDPQLTSQKFTQHQVGSFVVVNMMLSNRRRLTQIVSAKESFSGLSDFQAINRFTEEYEDILKEEAEKYRMLHGQSVGDMLEFEEATVEELAERSTRIHIEPKVKKLFDTALKISKRKHVAVMMVGPSGYGKTSIPQQIALDNGMDFHRQDCAMVRDPEEFFGYRGAKDGSTMEQDGDPIFTKTEFTRRVEEGNCVIVLDEVNRTDPYITNTLFPLLDHAGKTRVLGKEIVVGPNVLFVGTMNIGYQFTGTFGLDTALSNRFIANILVGPLDKQVEKDILMTRCGLDRPTASKIIEVITSLREISMRGEITADVSTRTSIQVGELIAAGLDIRDAFVFNVVNSVSQDEAKNLVDALGTLV